MPTILLRLCLLFFVIFPCALARSTPATDKSAICTAQPAAQQVTLIGFTRARATLPLTAEVSGRVEQVTADVGDEIAADGVFAVIDSTLVELELKANRVALRQLRRTLKHDGKQVERYRQLLSSKSSSQVRFDELLLQRDQSRLKIEQLQVEELRLEELLNRHTVVAPAGWRIMERTAEPGEWVSAGKVLARAGDYRHLIIPLTVTTSELKSLRQEKKISVSFPDLDIRGSATLYHLSPAFDPVSRKIKVEVLLSPETCTNLPLRQGGLRAEIRLTVPDSMQAFVLPARAVTERYEEHWLTRVDGSRIRVIVLGPARDSADAPEPRLRIVSPEIKAGDRFILSGSP